MQPAHYPAKKVVSRICPCWRMQEVVIYEQAQRNARKYNGERAKEDRIKATTRKPAPPEVAHESTSPLSPPTVHL